MAEQQSSEFEWQPRLSEKAILGGVAFDIVKAKELIKATPRPVEMKPCSLFKPAYYLLGIDVDWEKAKQANMAFPVIGCIHDGKAVIVDGWHRYAHAIRANTPEIPVVMLTDEEYQQVRKK